MTTYNKETGQAVIGFDMGGDDHILYSFFMPCDRRVNMSQKNAKKCFFAINS